MGNDAMLLAEVSIKGTRPLLYNTFSQDKLSLEKKENMGVAGNNPHEWKDTFLVNKNGQFYLYPSYIFGCMREAARYTKSGRTSIQSMLSATLQIFSDEILINRFLPSNELTQNQELPVYLDIRSVRNPSTKGRNIRYRVALSPGWETTFKIVFDKSIVSRRQIQSVLNDAGALVGLGDGRNIGFGRFEVKSIDFFDFRSYLGRMVNAKEKDAI